MDYGGVVFIEVTAAAVLKKGRKMMERRVRGDERGGKRVKEGAKEALTAAVWGQENDFCVDMVVVVVVMVVVIYL